MNVLLSLLISLLLVNYWSSALADRDPYCGSRLLQDESESILLFIDEKV